MIEKLLHEFMRLVEIGSIEIYNEFSLQHELGIFLRDKLDDYKIEFERNTKFFGITNTIKHEIDIVLYNKDTKYAIELKYPRNGQYPEQMFSFIKDICFMEELQNQGFDNTYCVTVVQDKNFCSGTKQDGIYAYFRAGEIINGDICKPTGLKNEIITLQQKYKINWCTHFGNIKYYIVKTVH